MYLAAEITLAALVVLVVLVVAAVFVRRRMIGHDSDVAACALRTTPEARWRPGLLRFTARSLQWYPLFGVTTRAAYAWTRASLDLSTPSTLDAERGLATVIGPEVMSVPTFGDVDDGSRMGFDLAMGPSAYTTLRYWVESAPPEDWRVYG